MIFKTLFYNRTSVVVVEKNVSVLWGDLNEDNPELNTYRKLQLKPNQKYEFEIDDVNNMWARFSKIEYIEDTRAKQMIIKVTQRKEWAKFDPVKGKYVTNFLNLTQLEWKFHSNWSGNFIVFPFIPKTINLSVLNPFAKFKEVEIRYTRRIDPISQTLKPRQAGALGIKSRSREELDQLEKDKEIVMAKYNLKEVSFDNKEGVGIL